MMTKDDAERCWLHIGDQIRFIAGAYDSGRKENARTRELKDMRVYTRKLAEAIDELCAYRATRYLR